MTVESWVDTESCDGPSRLLGLAGGGAVSLEVRWIHSGRLPSLLVDRLGPFAERVEVREDWYLTDPVLRNLSLKVRGGVRFDVKVFRHSPGQLALPGGIRGRLEVWEKWSFPLADARDPLQAGASWTPVEKARRRRSFGSADDGLVERPLAHAEAPGCSLELTDVRIDGEAWWTLALEAVGEPENLHRDLQAVAMTFINDPLSARFGLDTTASMSYQQRLRTRRDRV
jgi:hypothetical protein